jgi:N-acetylmuramoyl-L-alanine amidase
MTVEGYVQAIEKGYFQVKKRFLLFLSILLLIAVPLSAQKKTEVLLKFSKQEDLIRIVFEAEEPFINKTKVTTLPSQIRIEFPEPFTMTAKKDLPFEVVIKDKFLVVNLKEKSEIKFFRLSSPSRLVFDILKKEVQPEKQTLTIPFKVFALDPGHGGYDFGIIYGDISEKDISLSLAKDLYTVLSKKGKKVFLTRKVDQYVSLADRISLVNQKRPDIFISLHCSMSENFVLYNPKFEDQGSDEIVDPYSLSSRQRRYIEKSKDLSVSIEKAIEDEFKVDAIRREMPLPILNSVGAPSVLIEFPSPRFLVYDQQMRARLINTIINGIALYGQLSITKSLEYEH